MRFALIPGAGSDAWIWHLVVAALERRGHRALAVDLPRRDDDARLEDYADAAIAAIGDEHDDLAVVGQSLGAFTAPLVADRLHAGLLVLVCPMIPALGETPGEWGEHAGHAEAIAAVLAEHGPMSSWDLDALHAVFLHDVAPELVAENDRHSGPTGAGVFASALALDAWPDTVTRVIAGRDDRFFPPDFVARVSRERLGIEPDVVPGGHLAMLAEPEAMADQLAAYAGETSRSRPVSTS